MMKNLTRWALLACIAGLGARLAQAATWECCDVTAEVAEGLVTYEAVLPTTLGGETTPRQVLLDLWIQEAGSAGFLEATVAVAGDAEQLDGAGPSCLREGFLIQQGSSGIRATLDVTELVRSLAPSSVSRLYFRLDCTAGGGTSVALKENEEWGCGVRALWRAER